MLWAILIIGALAAVAAMGAERNTRHLEAMIMHLEQDKNALISEIELNRTKIDQVGQDVFDLKTEIRNAAGSYQDDLGD